MWLQKILLRKVVHVESRKQTKKKRNSNIERGRKRTNFQQRKRANSPDKKKSRGDEVKAKKQTETYKSSEHLEQCSASLRCKVRRVPTRSFPATK